MSSSDSPIFKVVGRLKGRLTVTVHGGKDLQSKQFIGTMDPYCVCSVKGEKLKSVVCKNGGRTPKWDHAFIFNVDAEPNEVLHLDVYNKEIITDDCIGRAAIELKNLVIYHSVRRWYQIVDKDNYSKIGGYCEITVSWEGSGVEPINKPTATPATAPATTPSAPAPTPATAPAPAPAPANVATAAPLPITVQVVTSQAPSAPHAAPVRPAGFYPAQPLGAPPIVASGAPLYYPPITAAPGGYGAPLPNYSAPVGAPAGYTYGGGAYGQAPPPGYPPAGYPPTGYPPNVAAYPPVANGYPGQQPYPVYR